MEHSQILTQRHIVNWFSIKMPRKFNKESITFSVSGGWIIGYTNAKKSCNSSHTICKIITSQWIIAINVINKNIRPLEQNIGNIFVFEG